MTIPVSIKTPANTAVAVQEIIPPFDYGDTSAKAVKEIEAAAKSYLDREYGWQKTTAQYAVEQGRLLHKVKVQLGHGKFLKWINKRLGVSDQTARNYMGLATLVEKSQTVLDLPATTVYKLAAPNTPPELQQEIIAKLESGEKPKPHEIVAEIEAAKAKEKEQAAKAKAEAKQKAKTPEQIAKEQKAEKSKAAYAAKKKAKQEAEQAAYVAQAKAKKEAAVNAADFFIERLGDEKEVFATLLAKTDIYDFMAVLKLKLPSVKKVAA